MTESINAIPDKAQLSNSERLSNGMKLVGETLLPGSSLLIDGRVTEGAAHAVVGLVARTLLGPIGWGLAAANSYSKSVSDQGLLDLAKGAVNSRKKAATPSVEDSDKTSS